MCHPEREVMREIRPWELAGLGGGQQGRVHAQWEVTHPSAPPWKTNDHEHLICHPTAPLSFARRHGTTPYGFHGVIQPSREPSHKRRRAKDCIIIIIKVPTSATWHANNKTAPSLRCTRITYLPHRSFPESSMAWMDEYITASWTD